MAFNFFTAFHRALQDPEAYYSFQKEMNSKAVEQVFFNFYNGRTVFEAVVLPMNLGTTYEPSDKKLRVRPLDIHDFIIPEPCIFEGEPDKIQKLLQLHPLAFPDVNSPENGNTETADAGFAVGETVFCRLVDGKSHALVYDRSKKSSTGLTRGFACVNSTDGKTSESMKDLFAKGGYGTATYGRPLTANYTGKAGNLQITNGQLPANVLGKTSRGVVVMIDAIEDLNRLAAAFQSQFNEPLKYSGYRPYNIQIKAYEDPKKILKDGSHLAARPGTSNHGWGLAIDISTKQVGYNTKPSFDSNPKYKWLFDNAAKYNWYHPRWAQEPDGWPEVEKAAKGEKGSKPESWHWEWSKKNTVFRKL